MDSMTNGTSRSCVSAITAIRKSADTLTNRGGYPDRTNFSSRPPGRPLHTRHKKAREKQVGNKGTSQKSPRGGIPRNSHGQGLNPAPPTLLINRNRPPRPRIRDSIKQQGRRQRSPQPHLPRQATCQSIAQSPNQQIRNRGQPSSTRHRIQPIVQVQKNVGHKQRKQGTRPTPRTGKVKRPTQGQSSQGRKVLRPTHPWTSTTK